MFWSKKIKTSLLIRRFRVKNAIHCLYRALSQSIWYVQLWCLASVEACFAQVSKFEGKVFSTLLKSDVLWSHWANWWQNKAHAPKNTRTVFCMVARDQFGNLLKRSKFPRSHWTLCGQQSASREAVSSNFGTQSYRQLYHLQFMCLFFCGKCNKILTFWLAWFLWLRTFNFYSY